MKGFNFIGSESQNRKVAQIYCKIFVCLSYNGAFLYNYVVILSLT